MKLIKVDAIDSTNSFLKEVIRNQKTKEPTCVWAKTQTNGKGQLGTKWESEPHKNLTFSTFLPISTHFHCSPFWINMLTTLCLHNCLHDYNLPNLKIKWPNDILSANKKIGGILIENSYQNGELTGTIIGIGLNVNQVNFKHLPKASSIKNITGLSLKLDELLNKILEKINNAFTNYTESDFNILKANFEQILFRNKKPSTFTAEGLDFPGIIQGITNEGKLIVLLEDNIIKTFSLKEISLKY